LLIFIILIPELQHASLPRSAASQGARLNLSPFIVVTFGLVIKSIKELGGASNLIIKGLFYLFSDIHVDLSMNVLSFKAKTPLNISGITL
jgi:hypothetical protein